MIASLFVLLVIGIVAQLAAGSDNSSTSSDDYQKRAAETYKRIIPCLSNNRYAHDHKIDQLVPPADAKQHYLDLLEKTKIFRGVPYHVYHYAGPWIGKCFFDSHWVFNRVHRELFYRALHKQTL